MRFSSKSTVEHDLNLHYKLRDKYQDELAQRSAYDGYILKRSKRPGNEHYSKRLLREKDLKYIPIEDSSEVTLIKEAVFIRKALEVIESNIALLEDFLTIYNRTQAASINELLPSTYRLQPSDKLLLDNVQADNWLKEAQAKKSKYPIFDPAGLTVTAFDGTLMRSRAEAIHYEAFYIYDIPVVFELPYEINGEVLRPDFTILDVFTMMQKMWEHLGNWFHEDLYKRNKYRAESMHRWDQYKTIGFYPEYNLLLSFGTKDNVFDIQSLHRKIAMFTSPPPSMETINMLKKK